MRLHFLLLVIAALLSFFAANTAFGQQPFSLQGLVVDSTGQPLENINIEFDGLEQKSLTNRAGGFSFTQLPNGRYTLLATAVGYAPLRREVTLPVNEPLRLVLRARNVGLEEVIVTARPRNLGSSSLIERSAILHTQPTSLADVLQLVAGQLATNPNLGVAAQVNLRQVPTTTDAARANALGTQLVLDGVPLSNNGNLQSNLNILNSGPSALPPFSSVAGRGNDLRQIPADNIESIEVVRGIPSARFGDFTSGLVIVTSRIGALRPELRVRLNPNLVQAAWAAGFTNKNKRNTYNISGDYLTATDDLRDNLNRYNRLQGQFTWQRFWDAEKRFTTINLLSGYKTLDALRQDPDDLRNQSRHYANDWGFKFSSEGRWRSKNKNLSANYIAAITYQQQTGFFQNLVTRDLFPISTATRDTIQVGVFGRSEYLNQTTVDGRPLNGYARAEAAYVLHTGVVSHRLLAGVEWRMDVNRGEGRQFDVLTPPRQNYSVGERPQSFRRIPALHQLGYYLEDRLSGRIGRQSYIMQAGLRIDNVAPQGMFSSKYKIIASPRINFSLETIKGLWLRGGYGITSKAMPLNFLYGGLRFFDLVGFNYFPTNPAERLTVITTRTINLDDQRFNPYAAQKWEAGFDLTKKGWVVAVSAFRETTRGAVGFSRQVMPMAFPVFRAQSFPPNQPPVLDPTPLRIDTFFAAYDKPVNNRFIRNIGVEYSIDVPEIAALRTRFNITGAYIKTDSYDDGFFTDADRAVFSTVLPQRVGVFPIGNRVIASRFNSSIRLVHRIPQLNMIVSGLWQTIWTSTSQSQPVPVFPVAYINRSGAIIPLSEEQAKSPAFTDIQRLPTDPVNIHFPPVHLFNIRLTKEWKNGYNFSFYANNFINLRPLQDNGSGLGLVRRNEPLFFGAELAITL